MDIYILRHGEAGGKAVIGGNDAERQLTDTGRKDIRCVSRFLSGQEPRFDLIAASPYVRAVETAGIVARTLGFTEDIDIWNELAPGGEISPVCGRLIRCMTRKRLVVVGHEPLLSTLLRHIIGGSDACRIRLAKAGCAKVRIMTADPALSGELEWLVTPAVIRKSCK